MPHVELVGTCELEPLAAALEGVITAAPPLVLKILDVYLSRDRQRLLLESLVVEGYLRQTFFLLLRRERDGLMIRCHPTSPVQKTDGVKRLIAAVAARCQALCPGSRVGHTNLADYLPSAPGT